MAFLGKRQEPSSRDAVKRWNVCKKWRRVARTLRMKMEEVANRWETIFSKNTSIALTTENFRIIGIFSPPPPPHLFLSPFFFMYNI